MSTPMSFYKAQEKKANPDVLKYKEAIDATDSEKFIASMKSEIQNMIEKMFGLLYFVPQCHKMQRLLSPYGPLEGNATPWVTSPSTDKNLCTWRTAAIWKILHRNILSCCLMVYCQTFNDSFQLA